MEGRDWERLEPGVAAGAIPLAAAMLVALVAGAPPKRAALPGLLAAALGAAAGFDAWRRERNAREEIGRQLDEVRARTEEEADRQRRERERLQHALRRAEDALDHQRELVRRLMQSRRAEREWNRELRGQLQRLYEAQRTHAPDEPSDVRELVLHTAIQLVEAPKGLLLSREDADGDGDLDVVVSHGFEHDPADSDVAQRFAREVLRSDEIVREDQPARDPRTASDADKEIDSLVAIPLYLRDRFHGVIVCVNRPGGFDEVDDDILLALGDHAGAALHQGQLLNELSEAQHAAIRTLLEAMAARDLGLHQESRGLTLHALALARELELEPRQRDALVYATLLRHVGYLAVPDHLLTEARPLQPHERAIIELHPRIGFNVIGQIAALRDVAAAVLYHHERFDGTGYPAGLAGDAIPITARALSVLEAYAAMTHDRAHRPRRSPDEACDALIAGAGTQFDPEIAQLLVEEIRSGPPPVDDALTDAVIEALPLNLAGHAGAGVSPLSAASTDGLTLLGNQRALHSDIGEATTDPSPPTVALALIHLEDLPRVNEDVGYGAGDHLIQVAARNAQRTAARFGGSAYRASGRRLAILVRLERAEAATELLDQMLTEFGGGSSVRTSIAVRHPGETAADLMRRARESLTRPEP